MASEWFREAVRRIDRELPSRPGAAEMFTVALELLVRYPDPFAPEGWCDSTVETLATGLRLEVDDVQRAVDELQRLGVVEPDPDRPGHWVLVSGMVPGPLPPEDRWQGQRLRLVSRGRGEAV